MNSYQETYIIVWLKEYDNVTQYQPVVQDKTRERGSDCRISCFPTNIKLTFSNMFYQWASTYPR